MTSASPSTTVPSRVPAPAGKEKGISVIAIHPDFDLSRIRVYLNSPRVAGWNEIDAVGLLDETGKTHWATSATASSTYADVGGGERGIIEELDATHPSTFDLSLQPGTPVPDSEPAASPSAESTR